jgi:hypothetical protein
MDEIIPVVATFQYPTIGLISTINENASGLMFENKLSQLLFLGLGLMLPDPHNDALKN